MAAIPSRPSAIPASEIATMLGITRDYVTKHITKRPDFPAPIINVSRRIRYWDRGQVLKWMQGTPRRRSTAV